MTLPDVVAEVEHLEIVYVRLEQLHDHPLNPKSHMTKELRESILRFGFAEVIVIDGRTGYMVSGHGRSKVLRAMEAEGADPPAWCERDIDGKYLVPAQIGWSSRDDDEALAFLIAANQITIAGGWVPELLTPVLVRISETPVAFVGTGFGADDLLRLSATTFRVNDEPSNPGTVYESQYGITIICEDEAEQVKLYDRLTAEGLDCRVVVT